MSLHRLIPLVLLAGVSAAPAGCGEGPDSDGRGGGPAGDVGGDATASAAGPAEAGSSRGTAVRALCDTIPNSFRCARAIERHQLPGAARATRRGDTLRLALATGDTARFVDEAGDHADVTHYSYQEHWTDAGYFLVHQQFYEGSQHLLVDDSAGARTPVPDRPIPAPGGSRFAVLSLDLVAGYGPNVLQIWSMDEDGPKREWETEPGQWGPTDGRWVDSATLRFTQRGYCGELGGSGRTLCERWATLRRAGGDWHLEVGPPEEG